MILSHDDIEDIAAATISDFNDFFYKGSIPESRTMPISQVIPLKRNQVLLDSSFIQPGQVKKLCGKRRFTLAHECAHQILFQLESDEGKAACRKQYAARRCYSLRDLKTREDWNEWQANALGAAILMPKEEIGFAMWRFASGRKLKNYLNRTKKYGF